MAGLCMISAAIAPVSTGGLFGVLSNTKGYPEWKFC
jgi:hypothetical protein